MHRLGKSPYNLRLDVIRVKKRSPGIRVESKSRLPERKIDDFAKAKFSILLMEDSLLSQAVMRKRITNCGWDITVTANGRLGVEMTKNKQFDLIITDFDMPELNGLQASQEIRIRELSKAPIIVWSSTVSSEDQEIFKTIGAKHFMSKDMNAEEMKDIISRYLLNKEPS